MKVIKSVGGRVNAALLALAALSVAYLLVPSQNAMAAADPTTGIDYAEIGSDTLASAKPAVVAGVAILVLITAVTLGKKLWRKVSS